MKLMFSVLGEGRGHMTQALAVRQIVERAGHEVTGVVLGAGRRRKVPPFFASASRTPIFQIPTFDFAFKNNRQVSLPVTLVSLAKRLPDYARAIHRLRSLVKRHSPDLILNFFEPITGAYTLFCRHRPPVLSIGHQFMVEHPHYVRAAGWEIQQWGLKWFTRMVGGDSARLALSFYDTPPHPSAKVTVCPPLLRRELFGLCPSNPGDFVLVYLLNHGYADQILAWHRRNPATRLHCFYDKPDAPPEHHVDDTLTFHRLDGEKFLRMMADCRCVVTTAGFESVSEAAYLGKPVFLVPVENHVEQRLNALDATRIGWGIMDERFNLDRLAELPASLPNAAYRSWLGRAEAILLNAIERTAAAARRTDDSHCQVNLRETGVA